jgi:thiamine biosynthesis protein ThiS
LRIEVNGESREVEQQTTLDDLIKQLALIPARLAIERNREVVRRHDWPHTLLAEGDRIEIVHFVGGGFSRSDG